MKHTADQCRAMGLTVGDTIVGRQKRSGDDWSDSELTLIFLGLQVAVFSVRTRNNQQPQWLSVGESGNWTLRVRDWEKVADVEDAAIAAVNQEAKPS